MGGIQYDKLILLFLYFLPQSYTKFQNVVFSDWIAYLISHIWFIFLF